MEPYEKLISSACSHNLVLIDDTHSSRPQDRYEDEPLNPNVCLTAYLSFHHDRPQTRSSDTYTLPVWSRNLSDQEWALLPFLAENHSFALAKVSQCELEVTAEMESEGHQTTQLHLFYS